jgi:hypothetical protein
VVSRNLQCLVNKLCETATSSYYAVVIFPRKNGQG